jgi:hypothetical protein
VACAPRRCTSGGSAARTPPYARSLSSSYAPQTSTVGAPLPPTSRLAPQRGRSLDEAPEVLSRRAGRVGDRMRRAARQAAPRRPGQLESGSAAVPDLTRSSRLA